MRTQCTNCGGGSGVKAWCVECVETLCQECVEAHKRVKLTRRHTILNQHPEDFPRLDSAASPRICSIHPQEVLQIYCFTCDQLTCRDCQIMNHRNHNFQFVREAHKSIRKQMYSALQNVAKHTETAKKSVEDLSSRIRDIHFQKDKLKISISKVLQSFVQLFKQRIIQHYSQVMMIYKSEEDVLQQMMQGLLAKVEEHTLRLRKVEDDDTTDIKTLLDRKTETESWSKWILGQDVRPPPSKVRVKLTINMASWKQILDFGEVQVSHVPFTCNDANPPVNPISQPKQSDTGGATAPTPPAASSSATFTNLPYLPYKPLPKTRNNPEKDPGQPEHSVHHSSGLGSATYNRYSLPPGQSNASNATPTTQSSPTSGSPQRPPQTNHQQYSKRQTSNVSLSYQRTSNFGCSQSSQSNLGQAATATPSPPPYGCQRHTSFVAKHPQPLPLNPAERTPSGAQTSMVPEPPASQLSYSLGLYPIGTNFYPIIGSSNIAKQNEGSTTAGPSENFVMVGKPIVARRPTLVFGHFNDNLPPKNDTQQVISGQLSRASTDTNHSHSVTSFHRYTALSVNHTTTMSLPDVAAKNASHDAVLPSGHLTHKKLDTVASVPSLPFTNPVNQLQSTLPVIVNNPLLYQIISEHPSSTSSALTSDPEHTQPGTDRGSEPKDAPPTPQGQPPTTKTVKALADSACDVSSSQGLDEPSLAPNIQENELSSTLSDTIPNEDVPSIISELLSFWEDGGELSDSQGDTTEVLPDETNTSSSKTASCSNKELKLFATSGMLKNMKHAANPLKRRRHNSGRKYPRKKARTEKDSSSKSSEQGTFSSDPSYSQSSEEKLIHPEVSEDTSKDDIGKAGCGIALKEGSSFFSPVVSLVRLPLSSVVPGRPLPRFLIHPGDTEEELFLEEMIQDDMSHDDRDDYLQPLSAPLSPDVDEVICACCRAPTGDVTCSLCGRSFHSNCHVPPAVLNGSDWVCSICQDLSDPRDPYTSERTYTPCLSLLDQRRCEHLLLCLLCEIGSTSGNPAEALGFVRDRLCHRQSPPYRTVSELVSDLQVTLNPPNTTESGAPSIWEGLQLFASGGDEVHWSPGGDGPPATPTHPPARQQTTEGPKVKMEPCSPEITGSDTQGDPGQGPEEEEEEEEEEKPGPSNPKDLEERWAKGKIKETRKRLKAFLKIPSRLPIKKKKKKKTKRNHHSQPDEES